MEPVYFLPSEIARMVLGYLKRENCAKAYKALLKESSHLGEYSALLKQGREYPTTVAGKTLTEMLQEYGHIKLRETRTLKCGQPATALWKQFDELVKVIKQQVSPKQLQQPHSKQGRPRLSDRILCTGRSSDPLPEVVSTRISSDVEERRSASSSAEGFQSVASPVTTCPSLVCHTGTPASVTACSSVQTTAMCTGVQELVTRPTGTAVYSTPPKSCQKITYTSQLTVAKSHQSEVASDSTYLLSEDCGYPVCPGSCGFDQLQANTEDLSDSDTGAITKAPNSVQAGGSIFGENLEFNATEKTDNVPDSCTVKPQESSSEPQMAPSEAQREEVRMVMVEDETEKELQTPMSVCQPVSQCENAIDSFEQAKALNSPSVGGNQVSAAWHGMSRLSESAFSSIGHTSGIGATTPVKQTSLSEHVHVTPSKSCSFLTTNSTKGKSPRRKRFAPKRRSSGAAGIGGIVTSGLPGTGTGNVPRSVEGSGAHKLGHSEESLISHHEDSMDIPSLVEQLLENTELQKKLAENINKGRHLSCDPAEQKPEGQPQQRVPPVTPSKPPPTPRNTSMQSLEDILDIHEAQMSDVEMNGIIDMTRSDPAFDALFQLFDNGNEQDDKGAGDPTLSFSSQIRMALETDEDQQQIETDMATATLLQLSERPSTSNCETAHSNSRVESCQRVLDCGQFGDDGEPVQKQMGSGQEMDTEGAKGNGLSVNSDTKVCEQQSMSGCHANQASSSHVGVGIVENNFPAVSGSCESYEKVVEIVTTVQHEDVSCNDQVHRAERRNTGQNTGDSKASVCTASTNHSPAGKSPGGARSVSQSVTTKTDLPSDIRPCSNRAWVDASRLEFHVTSESTSSPAQSHHSSVLGHSSNNDAPISSTRATKHPRKGKRPQNSAKVQIKTSCEPVVVVLAENSGGSNTVNDMDQGTKMSDYHKDTYRSSQVLTADGKANVMQKKNKVHSSTDRSNKSKIPSQEKVNVLNTSEYVPLSDNFAHDSSSDLDDGHRCKVSSDPMLSSTPKCSSHKLGLRKSDGCPGPASGAQGSPMSKSTSSFELAAESFAAGSEQNTSGSLVTARKVDLTQSSSTVSPGLSALLQIASMLPERETVSQGQVVTTTVQTSQGQVSGEFIITQIHELAEGSLGAEDQCLLPPGSVREENEQSSLLSSPIGTAQALVSSTSNAQGVNCTVSEEMVEKVHQAKDKTAETACQRRTSTAAIPFAKNSQETLISNKLTTDSEELSEENRHKPSAEDQHSCASSPTGRKDGNKNSASKCSVKKASATKQNKSRAGKQDAGCSSVSKALPRRSSRLADKSSSVSPENSASTPVKHLDVSSPYFVSPSTAMCEQHANSCVDSASERKRENMAASFTPEKVSTTNAGRKLPNLDLDANGDKIVTPAKVSTTNAGRKLPSLDLDAPGDKTIAPKKVSTTNAGRNLPNLDLNTPSDKTITSEKVSTTNTGRNLPSLDLNTSTETNCIVGSIKKTLKIPMKQQPRKRISPVQAIPVEWLNTSGLNTSSKQKSGRQPRKVHLQVAPTCPIPSPLVLKPVGSLVWSGISAFPRLQFTQVAKCVVPLTDNRLLQGTQPLAKLSVPSSSMTTSHQEDVRPVLPCRSPAVEMRTQGSVASRNIQALKTATAAPARGVLDLCTKPSTSEAMEKCKAALSAKLKGKKQPNAEVSGVELKQKPSMGGDAHSDLTTIDWTQFNEDKQTRLTSKVMPENKRRRKKRGVRECEQAITQGAEAKKSKMDVDLSELEIEKLLSFVHKT